VLVDWRWVLVIVLRVFHRQVIIDFLRVFHCAGTRPSTRFSPDA
jgi:hypothetical protein